MSTVKATNLQNASSSVASAVTTSGGDLTNAAGVSFMGGSKNLLYNGAMQVAQRGTSSTGITTANAAYYTADRWATNVASLGTWTQSVEADGPTGSGLTKSLKMLATTGASLSAASQVQIIQRLEGQDVQRVAKGSASAQQLTVSFWVKSNVTGTYVAELYDADNNRMVSATYSVSASATWERKTITFPADTTGAFDNDNAASLWLVMWLAAGSNFTSGVLQTTWATYDATKRAAGQTNAGASTNNYWQVTGVQLEVGPVASSFEFKSFGQELRECQRYYWRNTTTGAYGTFGPAMATSGTNAAVIITNPVPMRTTPTSIDSASLAVTDFVSVNSAVTSISITAAESTPLVMRLDCGASSLTQYRPLALRANNSTSAYVGFSAEL